MRRTSLEFYLGGVFDLGGVFVCACGTRVRSGGVVGSLAQAVALRVHQGVEAARELQTEASQVARVVDATHVSPHAHSELAWTDV